MKVQLQSKKFIKPSTPTPPNSRTHKISFIDEHAPKMYIPLILYYPAPPNANNEHLFSSTCNQLEKSLAQTLVQFYPLAGRYNKDLHIVNCNDEGVEFVEAKVDFHLHEILERAAKLDPEQQLNSFIPSEICINEEITDPLLAIQVTMFKCGGLALGVCMSHRIADASTLSMFLESWTSASNNQQFKCSKEVCPIFDSASFFPGRNYTAGISLEGLRNINNVVTRRLLFDNKAISSLRAKTNPGPNDKPKSKVQLVNAVLWKAIASVERLKDEHSRAGLILQPLNLREKTIHQVPKNCCGNLCLLAIVPVTGGENTEIQDLADLLSGSIKWSFEEWTKIVSRGEDDPFLENLMRSLVNYYMITSWCRFPFYEDDFGWGKPSWVSSVNLPVKNWIFLMDDKNGDGIEVWVNLDEKDMLVFEQACDIQTFATKLAGASARIAQNHQDLSSLL